MSGGVDSAVAALFLKQQGHEVVGMSLRVYDDNGCAGRAKTCCAPKDLIDARETAQALDIPFYTLDVRQEFSEKIIKPFGKDYLCGRTPNPCVGCNAQFKFGLLSKRARALGLERVATGHYARLLPSDSSKTIRLLRGKDPKKDQSYFLSSMSQEHLANTLFPLGDLTKKEVRAMALAAGLPVSEKPESQEICFVPNNDYAAVVADQFPQAHFAKGTIVNEAGEVLGEHQGIIHFTVGQRKGLGIAHPVPLYVLKIDAEDNTVTVGPKERLFRREMAVDSVHWIHSQGPGGKPPWRYEVAIRSRHLPAWATVSPLGQDCVEVLFDEGQAAITPGQAAVFYSGDEVFGGGWIS